MAIPHLGSVPKRLKRRIPPPRTGQPIYLWLSALAFIISIIKAPTFPTSDPALFEYFGKGMLHGQRLYVDLVDNKLPSIYVVNMLWQILFGSNYALHMLAEAAVNGGSIIFFALMLRKAGVTSWALGAFLFAAFFTIPFPQFNFTQHYAVFFIILGYYLSFSGRYFWGGLAIAVASSFWIPGVLTCIPVLLREITTRQRLAFAGGLIALYAVGAVVALRFVGVQMVGRLAQMWPNYIFSHMDNAGQVQFTVFKLALIPGLATLLAILFLVLRRPITDPARFALVWFACALLGAFIPPSLYEHYFLSIVPALSMAIAAFGITKRDVVRRPALAVVAAILLAVTIRQTIVVAVDYQRYTSYVRDFGSWMNAALGDGAPIYTPEYVYEVQLASNGLLPGPYADPTTWIRKPQAFVFGPYFWPDAAKEHRPILAKNGNVTTLYVPVCPGLTGKLAVYVLREKAPSFSCRTK